MRIHLVIHVLGRLLIFLALAMLLPIPFSISYGDKQVLTFLLTSALTFLTGFLLFKLTALNQDVRLKEGFAIVTLSWTLFALFGCLPFLLSGHIPNFTDAFFETMSGFTTTGASILNNTEALPHSLLFWRSLTHWLGGMGIIVLSIAVLPLLGVGGMQLFRAEVPGPVPDKLSPRITETAKILWGVYALISALETALLMLGGMNLFDALCHTFGTMATGGFSTKHASLGHFQNPFIHYVVIFFMMVAGTNFSLHYRFLKKDFTSYFKNHEFRFFMMLIGGGTVFVGIPLLLQNFSRLESTFRHTLFQVVSILTTTGFVTADYEQWGVSSQFLLFLFMFVGGCAGSTGGGMKIVRLMILLQFARSEVKRLLHPHAVVPVRIGESVIPRDVVANVLGFQILMFGLALTGVLLMTLLGSDLTSSLGAVAATLGNIGPGLGAVGPSSNYASIPVAGKWILTLFMLAGRLEIYTVLILFAPSFWKK